MSGWWYLCVYLIGLFMLIRYRAVRLTGNTNIDIIIIPPLDTNTNLSVKSYLTDCRFWSSLSLFQYVEFSHLKSVYLDKQIRPLVDFSLEKKWSKNTLHCGIECSYINIAGESPPCWWWCDHWVSVAGGPETNELEINHLDWPEPN